MQINGSEICQSLDNLIWNFCSITSCADDFKAISISRLKHIYVYVLALTWRIIINMMRLSQSKLRVWKLESLKQIGSVLTSLHEEHHLSATMLLWRECWSGVTFSLRGITALPTDWYLPQVEFCPSAGGTTLPRRYAAAQDHSSSFQNSGYFTGDACLGSLARGTSCLRWRFALAAKCAGSFASLPSREHGRLWEIQPMWEVGKRTRPRFGSVSLFTCEWEWVTLNCRHIFSVIDRVKWAGVEVIKAQDGQQEISMLSLVLDIKNSFKGPLCEICLHLRFL